METKKLVGLKEAVNKMKRYSYVRVYLNVRTGRLIPVEYTDCNSYTAFADKDIFEVFAYNYAKQHVPTMAELKEEIKEQLVNILDR